MKVSLVVDGIEGYRELEGILRYLREQNESLLRNAKREGLCRKVQIVVEL